MILERALADMTAKRDRLAEKVGKLAAALAEANDRNRTLTTRITELTAERDEARAGGAQMGRAWEGNQDLLAAAEARIAEMETALIAALEYLQGQNPYHRSGGWMNRDLRIRLAALNPGDQK